MSETIGPEPPASAFDVVPIVISNYNTLPDLPTGDEEAEQVATILARWGGVLRPWEVCGPERTFDTAIARLDSWSQPAASRSSLLLWIGHGSSTDDDAVVRVPAGGNVDAAFPPTELARYIISEDRLRDDHDWAIVVVEACGGIRFVELIESVLAQHRVRDGVLLIGSGEDRGDGYLGTFRRALAQICAAYWSNDKEISIRDLANRFEDVLRPGFVRAMGLSGRSPLIPRRDLTPALTTAVDFYPDLENIVAELPESELIKLARSGLGSDLLEIGGHFVGRVAERSAVATWLETHDTGMLVVTGGAGSGKSALLANLLLHAVPALRVALRRSPRLSDGWAGGDRIPPINGALLLTGATTTDVVTRLTRVADVEVPADLPPSERAEALVKMFAEREISLTLFADALDEARDPAEIGALLVRLTQLAGMRIVLATRSEDDGNDGLVSLLRGPGQGVEILRLQDDQSAILEFATERLRAAVPAVDATDLAATLADLTERLTGGANAAPGYDFLHIRLLVTELLATPDLLRTSRASERRQTLALDRPALFLRAMGRLVSTHPQAESLLRALAYAQGRGLPRADRIWATVAGVLAPGHAFTEADIDRILRMAGPYIMLDAEDGRSVFRLVHRTFTEELRSRLGDPVRREVLRVLIELTREAADPSPYLRRHLSGHAAALGRAGWSALADADRVLDRLDLATILADSWRSPADDLPPSVLAVRRTAHLALAGAEDDRCGYRQLGAAQENGHYSPTVVPVPGAAWQVTGARLIRHPSHQTSSPGLRVPVRALAVCTRADGTVVVAYGNDDGHIRMWNPWQGTTTDLTPDTGRGGEILGLAPLDGAHGLMLAAVGSGQPIRLWLRDGDLAPLELAVRDGGTACVIQCSAGNGTPLLAVGTTNGRLRLVSPGHDTGHRWSKQLAGHTRRITGLATIDGADGRELVSVSADRTLRRWSLPHGVRRRVKGTSPAPLKSVAVAQKAGLILTGDTEGVVTVWRLETLEPIRSFTAHDGPVLALSVLPDDSGRTILASGGADRRVRLWDMTGAPGGPDLTGHDDEVTDLVTLRSPDGAPLVVSASRDGRVKIWTPTSTTTEPSAVASGPGRTDPPERWDLVTSDGQAITVTRATSGQLSCQVADGPVVVLPIAANRARCVAVLSREGAVFVATGGTNGVHTWHAGTGALAGPPLKGHRDWVSALLAQRLDDADTVLLSGDDDGRVCVWDPWSGDLRRHVDLGTAIQSLKPGTGDRRFAVVFDDGEIEIELSDDIYRQPERGI